MFGGLGVHRPRLDHVHDVSDLQFPLGSGVGDDVGDGVGSFLDLAVVPAVQLQRLQSVADETSEVPGVRVGQGGEAAGSVDEGRLLLGFPVKHGGLGWTAGGLWEGEREDFVRFGLVYISS